MKFLTDEQLDEPIATLEEHGLSCRLLNMLEDKLGAVYVRDLLQYSRDDLLAVDEFGMKSVCTIVQSLESFLEQSRMRQKESE